jgi:hypothetical protein
MSAGSDVTDGLVGMRHAKLAGHQIK